MTGIKINLTDYQLKKTSNALKNRRLLNFDCPTNKSTKKVSIRYC